MSWLKRSKCTYNPDWILKIDPEHREEALKNQRAFLTGDCGEPALAQALYEEGKAKIEGRKLEKKKVKKYWSNDELGFYLVMCTFAIMIIFTIIWVHFIEPVGLLFIFDTLIWLDKELMTSILASILIICIIISAIIFVKNEDKNKRNQHKVQ